MFSKETNWGSPYVALSSRLPPFGMASGWYVIAASSELKPGRVLCRHYFNRELVLFRTESGAPCVADAYCPHLGAHLGKLGRVEGEQLRCGFHGFRFDRTGACVATGYGQPPPKARLGVCHFREQNGIILAWFHPLGHDPNWTVPSVDNDGWTAMRWRRFRIETTPQETTENSVDFGHFAQLHGFENGSVQSPLSVAGPHLATTYAGRRLYRLLGGPAVKVDIRYDVDVWGLGYSHVRVTFPILPVQGHGLRVWVLATPLTESAVDLILGVSTPHSLRPLSRLFRSMALWMISHEVKTDLGVWNYKRYVDKPCLTVGDGPIMSYRRWAAQFYDANAPAESVLLGAAASCSQAADASLLQRVSA